MSKRQRVERETQEYADMLQRMIRRYGVRVAEADDVDLAEMAEVKAVLDEAIAVAVAGQRLRGASWTDIGRTFRITKQSAYERWSRAAVGTP